MILVGDIGGTNSRLALARANGSRVSIEQLEVSDSRQADGLAPILERYLAGKNATLEAAGFGIPGPVLGPGCPRCNKLAEDVLKAAMELDIKYKFEKVTDMRDIMAMGVMMTPALVIDGVVKISGKVPSVDELKKMLSE
ncbi:MAG: TM0996/MTH895 family glutaredoxin-like protein [Acidobacteriota bacterium]|nr:MAG: TM0996/MTH895 family glutaredoxin-like protein [Acidobacteriota bacterium]